MNGRTNSHGSSINELQVPLDPCTSLRAEAGNGEVILYWDDPKDKYATPEGETAQDPQQLVSVWDHTIVVRKVGSQPANPNDGIVVTSSGVRDQYLSTGYVDTSLTNDTTYYYGVFAINKDGVASDGAFVDATPKFGTPLSEMAEGTIIKINENGAPVEFYLAKHNYEPNLNGQGRTLVVRKDLYNKRNWHNSNTNAWASSAILYWLNSGYKALLDTGVQKVLGTTTYRYTPGNHSSSVTTRSDAIFLLSLTEMNLGQSHAYVNKNEGSALPIVSTLEIANYDGWPATWWTRSPFLYDTLDACYVYYTGSYGSDRCDSSYGSRPAFTLPNTIEVDSEINVIMNMTV